MAISAAAVSGSSIAIFATENLSRLSSSRSSVRRGDRCVSVFRRLHLPSTPSAHSYYSHVSKFRILEVLISESHLSSVNFVFVYLHTK